MVASVPVLRLLTGASVLLAGGVSYTAAQERTTSADVRREVFAEHPAINVVNTIVRAQRDGKEGVLIVGSGNVSISCFVPDGGVPSCTPLKISGVDAAELIGSHDLASASVLVHGLWGEPALARLDHDGEVAWRFDAKFAAMGHFAVLADGDVRAAIAERTKGLLFFDALTGKELHRARLPGPLTDVFTVSGSDGRRYLMGLSGAGHVVVLDTNGQVMRASPQIGVYHAAASSGEHPVLFIAPKDTLYTLDQQLQRGGGWYAPGSADLHITAVDRSDTPNEVVVAMFHGSGQTRDLTALYAFGPDKRLLKMDASLYPNQGLLILSNGEHSLAFLAGDRGRTWRYTITW